MTVGAQKSPLSFIAGEDLEAHRLVRLHASTENTVVYADAGERAIGVTSVRAVSGEMVAVTTLNSGQTLKVIAAGTISANAAVYTANDGKVSDSVSGSTIGNLRSAGVAGEPAELIPFAMAGGGTDTDQVIFLDDFLFYDLDESGSEGTWVADANDGGAIVYTDAQGGVLTVTASDTTAADNDETYLVSVNEFWKPAAGAVNGEELARGYARIKFTEANTDDANVYFGMLGGDTIDVANTLADNGGGINTFQQIAIIKVDGGTVYQGRTYDSGANSDTNIGTRVSGSWAELMFVVSDADITDGSLEVTFFHNGVAGGSLSYALASAEEMRMILGIKNGGSNAESLLIDKVRLAFKR